MLPLDNSKTQRLDPSIRPSLTRGRHSFTYYVGVRRAAVTIQGEEWDVIARSITHDIGFDRMRPWRSLTPSRCSCQTPLEATRRRYWMVR